MIYAVNFETNGMHRPSQNKQRISFKEKIRNTFHTFKSQTNLPILILESKDGWVTVHFASKHKGKDSSKTQTHLSDSTAINSVSLTESSNSFNSVPFKSELTQPSQCELVPIYKYAWG